MFTSPSCNSHPNIIEVDQAGPSLEPQARTNFLRLIRFMHPTSIWNLWNMAAAYVDGLMLPSIFCWICLWKSCPHVHYLDYEFMDARTKKTPRSYISVLVFQYLYLNSLNRLLMCFLSCVEYTTITYVLLLGFPQQHRCCLILIFVTWWENDNVKPYLFKSN